MVFFANTKGTKDEQLFAAVFNLHFDGLYNYGLKITGDKDIVEDCIQEVFFRIWKNRIDLHTVTNIRSYLFKALRRQILNMLELKVNQHNKVEITEDIDFEFSAEDFYVQHQTEEAIRNKVLIAMKTLPARQNEAIYLRFFENLSFSEIASVMNIHIQSVKNSVARGLHIMKRILPGLLIIFSHGIVF